MFKSLFLPILAVAAFIVLVGLLSKGKLDGVLKKIAPTVTVTQKTIRVDTKEVKVEVAKSDEERAKGLGGRDSLAETSGMIFVFNKDSKPVFWMKDTKIALDIIWINEGKVVKIDENVQPEPNVADNELKRYPAPSAIDYVLEVNGGFSKKYGIKVGQMISGLEQL